MDNIYVRFGGQLFRQMVSIPIRTNCAPLLADLFLYSYENEFLDKLIKEGKRKLARKFNLSYRYIDDLVSFNNKRFKEFISDIYWYQSWYQVDFWKICHKLHLTKIWSLKNKKYHILTKLCKLGKF